jgi:hypothetical protein
MEISSPPSTQRRRPGTADPSSEYQTVPGKNEYDKLISHKNEFNFMCVRLATNLCCYLENRDADGEGR